MSKPECGTPVVLALEALKYALDVALGDEWNVGELQIPEGDKRAGVGLIAVRKMRAAIYALETVVPSETEAPYNPDDYDMRGEVPILKSPTDKKCDVAAPKDLAEASEIIRILRSELAAVAVAVGRSNADGYDVDWYELHKDCAPQSAVARRNEHLWKDMQGNYIDEGRRDNGALSSAWIIERSTVLIRNVAHDFDWWAGSSGWTRVKTEAVRFVRWADAQNVIDNALTPGAAERFMPTFHNDLEPVVQSATARIPVAVLREHWLHQIECNHETKQDMPICACSKVNLGWHPSVGAAVEAWLKHLQECSL